MFFVEEGFTFRNFLMDALAIFVLIVWFWLLITIASDLFRRHGNGARVINHRQREAEGDC